MADGVNNDRQLASLSGNDSVRDSRSKWRPSRSFPEPMALRGGIVVGRSQAATQPVWGFGKQYEVFGSIQKQVQALGDIAVRQSEAVTRPLRELGKQLEVFRNLQRRVDLNVQKYVAPDLQKRVELLGGMAARQSEAATRPLRELGKQLEVFRNLQRRVDLNVQKYVAPDLQKRVELLGGMAARQSEAATRPLRELGKQLEVFRNLQRRVDLDVQKRVELLGRLAAETGAIRALRLETGEASASLPGIKYASFPEAPIIRSRDDETDEQPESVGLTGVGFDECNIQTGGNSASTDWVAVWVTILLALLNWAYLEFWRAPRDAAALEATTDAILAEFESLSERLDEMAEHNRPDPVTTSAQATTTDGELGMGWSAQIEAESGANGLLADDVELEGGADQRR